MKRILLNIKLLKRAYITTLTAVTAIVSFLLLFINKEELGIKSAGRGVLCIVIMLIAPLFIAILKVCCYRTVIIKGDKPVIKVQYGDLWKIAFPKKKSDMRIVVINVNTTFDVIVDEDVVNIQKPLVSPTTMHGQLIKKLKEKGVDPETLLKEIKKSLNAQGISPKKTISRDIKPRGELDSYGKGTIAVYKYENTIFYLLAFSEFDENNNAHNSKDEMIRTVTTLVDYYNKHGQGYKMFVPLMGVGMSRTGISEKDSLKILSSLFDIHNDKLQGEVTIVVYEKDRDKVSIDV